VIATAAASGVVFILIAALVALRLTGSTDLGWTRAFQSVASPPLDLVANADTVVGQLSVTLVAAAALSFVIWRRLGGRAWLAPALILATGAVELAFKFGLQHAGPPDEFIRAFHNTLGIRVASPSSFPSGHLTRVTFLLIVLAGLWPGRAAGIAAGCAVAATVFLRVYIGDHWISDALGGAALGVSAGTLAVAWMRATARKGATS
jgi:membrane-associated phospholipid phosphatase